MGFFLHFVVYYRAILSRLKEKKKAKQVEQGFMSSCPFVGAQALTEDELPATPLGFPLIE